MGKKENILLIGLLIIVVVGLVFTLKGFIGSNNPDNIDSSSTRNEISLESNSKFEKKISESEVTVDLKPKELDNGKFYVDIGVNTHTVDLSQFDLMELTTLEINGRIIKPSSAPKLGGHHNSGTLIFDVDEELSSFKIKIKGIPEIEERVFEWE
jgi:hypothetical protein